MAPRDKRIVWSRKAKQDLRDIWRYFAEVANREIADRLLRDIAAAADRLVKQPLMGRPRAEVLPNLRSVRVHPYSVFYRVTANSIEIARVLHERRNLRAAFAD